MKESWQTGIFIYVKMLMYNWLHISLFVSIGSIANGRRIKTWWNTQRSAYGKVTRTVSGQGGGRLSAREERLKERLTFLSAHVYRVPKRAGKNVSKHALNINNKVRRQSCFEISVANFMINI